MALLGFIGVFVSWNIDKAVKGYFSLFLLLNTGVMGVFLPLLDISTASSIKADTPFLPNFDFADINLLPVLWYRDRQQEKPQLPYHPVWSF